MREKSLWIIISLLALALLLVIFNQLRQDQTLKELRQGRMSPEQEPAVVMGVSVNSIASTTKPMTATTTQVAPEEMRLELTRRPYGSLTSPDGRWRLDHQRTEESSSDRVLTVTHQLILRGLFGQPDRTIYTAKEYLNQGRFEALPGKPFASSWTPAGWSADGKKVYYTATPYMDGLGGAYADFEGGSMSLHEVTVDGGVHKQTYTTAGDIPMNGIQDVLPQRNLMVSTDYAQNIARVFVMDLNGQNKRMVLQTKPNQGISAVVLNGDGTRFAVVTHEADNQGEDGVGAYLYRVTGYDLVKKAPLNLVLQEMDMRPEFRGYAMGKWQSLTQFTLMEASAERVFEVR